MPLRPLNDCSSSSSNFPAMLRRCDFKNQSLQSLGILLGRQLTASAMAVVSSVHKVRQSKLYLVAALVANTTNINITNTNTYTSTGSYSQTNNTTTILRQNSDSVLDKQRNNKIGAAECSNEAKHDDNDDNDFG
uniref:Uncharacterized protein n=1 Tax=Bactrocera latifrons TaxID=174628 RepID=A0A0K8WIT1_BACLA